MYKGEGLSDVEVDTVSILTKKKEAIMSCKTMLTAVKQLIISILVHICRNVGKKDGHITGSHV